MPGDRVEVDPGTYTDTCSIGVQGLTLIGVGGRPKVDLSAGTPSGQKGIYVIDADDVTIENFELTGAQISVGAGENGAGVRVEKTRNFTVRGCFIHDNQDGILATPNTLSSRCSPSRATCSPATGAATAATTPGTAARTTST